MFVVVCCGIYHVLRRLCVGISWNSRKIKCCCRGWLNLSCSCCCSAGWPGTFKTTLLCLQQGWIKLQGLGVEKSYLALLEARSHNLLSPSILESKVYLNIVRLTCASTSDIIANKKILHDIHQVKNFPRVASLGVITPIKKKKHGLVSICHPYGFILRVKWTSFPWIISGNIIGVPWIQWSKIV